MEGDKAVSSVDAVIQEVEESCKRAAEECPVEAITIEE
jgi:ferredoxin